MRVNMAKSASYPIRCTTNIMDRVERITGCGAATFPCKYLGLSLTIQKQSTTQLVGLVDQLANALPRWKASKLPRSGRMLLIKSVLCAIPLHAMLTLDLPQKMIKAMNKICHGFLRCAKA